MLSDEVRSALLLADHMGAKTRGGRVHFRCPRHEDSSPSAWMAGGAWGCFACGFEESITTLAEILGVDMKRAAGTGYTLADYATAKRFPMDRLQEWGIESATYNGRHVVAIPYFAPDGTLLRRRFRSESGKWWEGRDLPIHLYGLDRLPDVAEGRPLLIVEGESDCHAAWLMGFDAVGVPGATTWKSEWADAVRGFELYVWEEPDQGGPQLVQRVARDFPTARVIRAEDAGTKDIADLYRTQGPEAASRLRGLMATAAPVGTPKPPVVFDVLLGDRIGKLIESKTRPIDAIPTPWPAWNHACCGSGGRRGIARGWHVIAAAKTGAGKSILALNMAVAAMRAGERVCFISLEMAQEEVETRLLAIAAGIPVRSVEQGEYFDRAAVHAAGQYLAALHEDTGGCFFVNRQPVHRLPDVIDSMRFQHDVHGCRFMIVDYLQLAGNPLKPETIVAVSNAVRRATVDLHVATFGLSQFNRMTSSAKESPTKEGLMGGSALENDAVQVLLIDHSKMQKAGDHLYWTDAILDKNRHGPNRTIPIQFNTATLQMRERMQDEE